MGQPCSSAKSKHQNKATQKKKSGTVSQNYKENANDHYIQGSVAIPQEPIPQVENKIAHEKADNNDNPEQLYRHERESEERDEKDVNNSDDEKDELEFSQAKAKRELSFEKKKDDFKDEIEGRDKKRDPKFVNNSNDENNELQFSQTKAKKDKDGSCEEEEKDDDSGNLFDENLGERPHHFRYLQREEQNNFQNNTETDCPICLESFTTLGEEPAFTICGHAFCSKCLKGALKIYPYCPLCRAYQSKPLQDTQGQQLYDRDEEESIEPLPQEEWNVEVVRAHLREIPEEGNFNRRVFLSNGEPTNIYVGKGAKINVSPNANLFINGKRVENPQDCNVQ